MLFHLPLLAVQLIRSDHAIIFNFKLNARRPIIWRRHSSPSAGACTFLRDGGRCIEKAHDDGWRVCACNIKVPKWWGKVRIGISASAHLCFDLIWWRCCTASDYLSVSNSLIMLFICNIFSSWLSFWSLIFNSHVSFSREAILAVAKTVHHDFGQFNQSLSVSLTSSNLKDIKSNPNVDWFEGDGRVIYCSIR